MKSKGKTHMNTKPEKKALHSGKQAGENSAAAARRKKIFKRAGIAAASALAMAAVLLYWLSWAPALEISNPTPARLTPGKCSRHISMKNLGETLAALGDKDAVKALGRKKVGQEFWRMFVAPELGVFKKKFNVEITPDRVLGMAATEVSYTTYKNPAAKSGPVDFLIITRLGVQDRILMNMARHKLGKSFKIYKFYVQKVLAGGTPYYITMGGDYLFITDSENLLRESLDLGMGRTDDSVDKDKTYSEAKKNLPDGRTLMEWFSPEPSASPFSNAKINFGAIQMGAGGLTLYFASEAESGDTPSSGAPVDFNPAGLVPASASIYTISHSFGRIWEDLLLGKAFTKEETGTFLSDLYGLGLNKLGDYFYGNVSVSVDGVFKHEDGMPVPNLIFIYKVKDEAKALETADKIFTKTIKGDYNRTAQESGGIKYVSFLAKDEGSALSLSYGIIGGYLIFTLTNEEMKKIINTAAGKIPAVTSTEGYRKNYSSEAAKQDMFMLMNGERLASDLTSYFTIFTDLSSRPLAEVITKLAIPTAASFNYVSSGVGGFNYKNGLLLGKVRLFPRAMPAKK